MKPNKILFLLLTAISLNQLTAKDYVLKTNINNVSCTLNTFTQERMAELLGTFDAFYLKMNRSNLFNDAINNYMAVTVTIKNYSSESITLPRGEYLQGFGSVFISKEEMIRQLYPRLNLALESKLHNQILSGLSLGLLSTGFLVYGGLCVDACNESSTRNEMRTKAVSSITAGCLIGLFGIDSLLTTIGLMKNIKLATKKEQSIKHQTFVSKLKGQSHERSTDTSIYEIPARSEFHDLLFVDLTKVPRDVFEQIQPTLVCEIEK